MRLEVNVNATCNVACPDCNRAIGFAKFADMNLTAAQMRMAVEQVIRQKKRIGRVTLAGGEPLLNKELQGIINECNRLPGLRYGRVLTNDIARDGARKTLVLPKRWKWVPAPIDDPTDPLSGKDAHEAFFTSPADGGTHAEWAPCSVRGYCGKGFDAYGWSMCGVAATIGRIIGVDPYWQDGPQAERSQEEICKHCVYGMTRKDHKAFIARVDVGELPRVSKTFEDGVKRHRTAPMTFPKFDGGD